MRIIIDAEKCIGCGICSEMCPEGVLALENEIARVVKLDDCIECKACEVNCEYDAVKCIDE